MNENDFANLFDDPLLPDLVPEGHAYDDLLNINEFAMFTPHPELTDLTRKFEALNIDSNTHGLRIEIERTKRQRLQATVKRLKHEFLQHAPTLLSCVMKLTNFVNSKTLSIFN